MATEEEVFKLYERNSNYYYDCRRNYEIDKCTEWWNDKCYCYLQQNVMPFTIGNQCSPCELKCKIYIKPGEECPICYEKILNKSTAFITECGHNFHKLCLFKYMESKWQSSTYLSVARCPICRNSLGDPPFAQRYRSNYFEFTNVIDDNNLDKLEDFWLTKDLRLPKYCSNTFNHYLGMNDNCYICKCYRSTGYF
jgi:Ring finger domain